MNLEPVHTPPKTPAQERGWRGMLRGGALAAVILGLTIGSGTVAAEEVQPESPPLPVKLTLDGLSRLWVAEINGVAALKPADFAVSHAPVKRAEVEFATDLERLFLTVGPSPRPLLISVEGFPDWTLLVPTNNRCAFRINPTQRLVDLTAPSENTTNISISFPDGGKAELGRVSFARYDVMDDTSYYFSGQGKVEAQEADGVKKLLSPLGYPMMGGPLNEYKDDKGRRRLRRIIPPVAFSISGELRQQLAIATSSGTITLPANRSAVLEMENGALVSFTHDASDGWLHWQVQKGYVHFHIPEIRCWRAMALTDQRGSIQWSGEASAVDMNNTTSREVHPPNRFVIASLSHSMTGAVGPGNLLQYMQFEECRRFSVAGVGDEVYLRDNASGEVSKVPPSSLMVQHSLPTGGVAGTPDTIVTTTVNGTVIVRTSGRNVALQPGTEQTVTSPNGQQLFIQVGGDGTVRITATTGDHTFGTGPLGDWTFTVKEGDTFVFSPTGRRDVFIVGSGPDNSQPMEVFSPEGFRPILPGDSSLTFVTGDTQTSVEPRDGLMVFYERGGVTGEVPFGTAPVSPPSMDARGTPQPFGRLVEFSDPTQLLPPGTRIPVPPASVVK